MGWLHLLRRLVVPLAAAMVLGGIAPDRLSPADAGTVSGSARFADVSAADSWSWDLSLQTDRELADPSALAVGSDLHVYATTATHCGQRGCATYWVPRFSGTSLAEPGTLQGDAMPDRPAWVARDDRVIWAPSVVLIGESYVMHFAATSGRPPYAGLKCLGVAVSPSSAGPFVPSPEPLRCTQRYWNIDPYAVSDGAHWYLLWRADDAADVTGKIVVARLSPDGLGLEGDRITLLVGERPWEEASRDGIGPIENPALARHPTTGEWLLTWSANRWETQDYATGMARCDGPMGPCDRLSHDLPWLRTSFDSGIQTAADFGGAGGLAFVAGSDGGLYALFHAYRGAGQHPDSPRVGWAYRVEARDGYVLTEA